MNLTLKIWRQNGPEDPGAMHEYQVRGISEESSFLEMLDVLNEELFARGEEPIAFDSDCREGICGQCGIVINGIAHGPEVTTTCQLHMRSFNDGDVITIEPWRAEAFPIIKDLVVNRSALDRIVQAGGYISVNTGGAPEAHSVPVQKEKADAAFEAAACIGCGACVAACPNGAAALFAGAKLAHLSLMPQGRIERGRRARAMTRELDALFGPCSEFGECLPACPAGIPIEAIALLNREVLRAGLRGATRDD